MKTFLTILIIVGLLALTIYILSRRAKDDSLNDTDADYDHCPGSDGKPCGIEEEDAEPIDEPEEVEEIVDEPAIPAEQEEEAKEVEETNNDVEYDGIINKCKIDEEPDINIPNKYFYRLHTYTTAKGRSIFCIVCNAVIKDKIYKIIVNRSFYPYIISYTENVVSKIIERYTSDMTVEEFLKTGSTKYDRIGKPIDCDVIDNIN